MNIFDSYTKTVLLKLNERKVDYIVIGGYAVNYHGYRRTTGDIDLWIRPDNGITKERILECLSELAVPDSGIERVRKMDFTKPSMLGMEPNLLG
jgi:predicted nucleotidyltransferase